MRGGIKPLHTKCAGRVDRVLGILNYRKWPTRVNSTKYRANSLKALSANNSFLTWGLISAVTDQSVMRREAIRLKGRIDPLSGNLTPRNRLSKSRTETNRLVVVRIRVRPPYKAGVTQTHASLDSGRDNIGHPLILAPSAWCAFNARITTSVDLIIPASFDISRIGSTSISVIKVCLDRKITHSLKKRAIR